MAAGTRKKYALDLNDIIAFPDAKHIPLLPPEEGESWVILMEVMAEDSTFPPVFSVRDITGTEFGVGLYTPNPREDAEKFKIGHTVCITSARPNMRNGIRIEDPNTIEVLPVSLAMLWAINAELRERSQSRKFSRCNACEKRTKSECTGCKSRYCDRKCQRKDWPRHKPRCMALKALHRWNVTDWG